MGLRTRIRADHAAGRTFADLGRHDRVSAACVRQPVRRHQATGAVAPRPPVNRRVPRRRRRGAAPRAAVAADPGLTLAALRDRLGLDGDRSTRWAARRAPKLSVKKPPVAAARDRPAVAAERAVVHAVRGGAAPTPRGSWSSTSLG